MGACADVRVELRKLCSKSDQDAQELLDMQEQHRVLMEDLARMLARAEDAETRHAEADGERRAYQGEARELRQEVCVKQQEVGAQLLLMHEKEREKQSLETQLEDRTTEAIERQFKLALAAMPDEEVYPIPSTHNNRSVRGSRVQPVGNTGRRSSGSVGPPLPPLPLAPRQPSREPKAAAMRQRPQQ